MRTTASSALVHDRLESQFGHLTAARARPQYARMSKDMDPVQRGLFFARAQHSASPAQPLHKGWAREEMYKQHTLLSMVAAATLQRDQRHSSHPCAGHERLGAPQARSNAQTGRTHTTTTTCRHPGLGRGARGASRDARSTQPKMPDASADWAVDRCGRKHTDANCAKGAEQQRHSSMLEEQCPATPPMHRQAHKHTCMRATDWQH